MLGVYIDSNTTSNTTSLDICAETPEPRKKKPRKAKPFVPPTLEEVEAYCKEKGYTFSAQSFFDYYASSNWHFSNGKPVKNWKQCCVTWNSNRQYDKPQRKPVDASQYRAEAWGNVEYRGA